MYVKIKKFVSENPKTCLAISAVGFGIVAYTIRRQISASPQISPALSIISDPVVEEPMVKASSVFGL